MWKTVDPLLLDVFYWLIAKMVLNNSYFRRILSPSLRPGRILSRNIESNSKEGVHQEVNSRNGFGVHTCNGWTYTGEWKDGKRHGFGSCMYGKLLEYRGEWKDDKRHGWGKLRTRGHALEPWRVYGYNGQFENDMQHGVGYTATSSPPYFEKGMWRNGIKEGGSVISSSDSTVSSSSSASLDDNYVGDKLNGQKHGNGTIVYPDGSKYRGQWQHDLRSGWGEYSDLFGDSYRGYWKSDEREGQGEAVYGTGDRYSGEWKNGKYNGAGKYVSSVLGSTMEGTWYDGLMSGPGVEITTKGVFEGNFLESAWCGQGKFMDSFGHTHVGLWIDRKMNGFGCRYDAHGNIIEEGIFVDGKLQRE